MKKLLFFGDVAPNYISGTSIAAQINLEILKDFFKILHVEEQDDWRHHTKHNFSKVNRNIKHAVALFKTCRKEKPSIFYSHLPSSVFGMAKMLSLIFAVKLASRPKIVLHLHRGDFHINHSRSLWFRILSRIISVNIDHIIVLSGHHKSSLKNVFPKSKMKILRNTIEQEKQYIPKSSSKISFLYISNYTLEKGILDLLDTFTTVSNHYHDIELHAYGNSFDQAFMDQVNSYNNGRNIFIHGKIEGQNKFQAIADADCLILPSWTEGQPLIILEAMSQGTSVIATYVGFIPEMLGQKHSLLFEPKNRKGLQNQISQFIKNRNGNEIRQTLRERYLSLFSRGKHREQLLNIFTSL